MLATTDHNYAFIMNVASLPGEAYTIAPGHVLRKATAAEVMEIKRWIEQLSGTSLFLPALWEAQVPMPTRITILPPEAWRYYVIDFKGNGAVMLDIQSAADLSPVELEVGFTVAGPGGVTFIPGRLFHVVENAGFRNDFFVHFSATDLEMTKTLCRQLRASDDRVIDTKSLATQVGGLKSLSYGSPLRFLGYFAILESLLTHVPDPSDPYQSITRQIKKKITLLNRRWDRPIDYSLFAGASPETVWTRMYEYRSLLAHGGKTDFSGKLAILGSHQQSLALLKETVKAVIRHTLSEAQLLLDLRDC
jgi:hypothetical protein